MNKGKLMNSTQVKTLNEIKTGALKLPVEFFLKAIINDDNMTYIAYNTRTQEVIIIDPMLDDWDTLMKEISELEGYRMIAVLDTHTHADHISCAVKLAESLKAPLIMHKNAASSKVSLRVCNDTHLSTAAGPLSLIPTPGHTWDSLLIIWGPFAFTGDTILFGDTGRDDLPTGNPTEHYESLLKIKSLLKPDHIMLAGHDGKGGRAGLWSEQLELNDSLKQSREDFIRDASAYSGPSPKLLKESLFYNFK